MSTIMDQLAVECGFTDANEMNSMIVKIDLAIPGNMKIFKKWRDEDGTKSGLLDVIEEGKLNTLYLDIKNGNKETGLKALVEYVKQGNQEAINNLCCSLFIRKDAGCDWANIKAFELMLPEAKVVCLEKDSFGWLIGGIRYNGKTYSYG